MGPYLGDWDSFLADAKARTALPAAPAPAPAPVPANPSVIRAANVTFAYDGAAAPVLTGIPLTVRRGRSWRSSATTAPASPPWPSFSPASTPPTSGTVNRDGTDLTAVDPDELFARLAMPPQDIARRQATLRENITLGQGDGAVLAAARAYARSHAPPLICDEPTSTLDPRAEQAAYDRIRELAASRTVILITHRLGSTQHADRIVALDHGRILEEGSHHDLLAAGGEYAAMWTAQASAYPPVTVP